MRASEAGSSLGVRGARGARVRRAFVAGALGTVPGIMPVACAVVAGALASIVAVVNFAAMDLSIHEGSELSFSPRSGESEMNSCFPW